MDQRLSYTFVPAPACVMCGSERSRVLGRRLRGHQGLRPRQRRTIATTVVQCGACGLIYANPRPVPATLGQHYDLAPEEYWTDDYLSGAVQSFTGEAQQFLELWKGSGKPRALDVGAGLGKAMRTLERHGFDVFGFEPSRTFHAQALERGISADRLQLAAIEDAAYAPGSFDFVAMGAVLEHLHHPADSIERAFGWLAPGGLMHIEVPSTSWLLGRALNLVYRMQGVDCVTNLSPMHPPFHLYEFSLESFRRHGQRAGYDVIAHQLFIGDTFAPAPLAGWLSEVMRRTGTGMQLQVWLGKQG